MPPSRLVGPLALRPNTFKQVPSLGLMRTAWSRLPLWEQHTPTPCLVEGAPCLPDAVNGPDARLGLAGAIGPPLANDPMQLGPLLLRSVKGFTDLFPEPFIPNPELVLCHDRLLRQGCKTRLWFFQVCPVALSASPHQAALV